MPRFRSAGERHCILRVEMEPLGETPMRPITPLLAALAITSALATPAHADPYKWCAVYGGFCKTREKCYYKKPWERPATGSRLRGVCKPSPRDKGKARRGPGGGAQPPPQRPARAP